MGPHQLDKSIVWYFKPLSPIVELPLVKVFLSAKSCDAYAAAFLSLQDLLPLPALACGFHLRSPDAGCENQQDKPSSIAHQDVGVGRSLCCILW
jgi:hypothetical protein